MREFVNIVAESTAADGYGGQSVTWPTLYENVPADVMPVRGREGEVHGRLRTIETYLVRVRYGLTITTLNRVIWQGKELDIRSAQDRDGTRRFLTLECEVGYGPD